MIISQPRSSLRPGMALVVGMSDLMMVDPVDQLAEAHPPDPSKPDEEFINHSICGRYLTAEGRDLPCRVIKMSTTHAAIVGTERGEEGEIVVLHLDNIGMLRGRVSRSLTDGFIIRLYMTERRRQDVRSALQWRAERACSSEEMRASPRIVPVNRAVEIWLGASLSVRGLILNISVSGAAIAMKPSETPFQGAPVKTGRRAARVVRLIEKGIAVQFDKPFGWREFDHDIVL